MEHTVKQIEQADEIQLKQIIDTVIRRYNALHTDREAGFLSLSTDSDVRIAELDRIIAFIRSGYNRLE